MKSEQVGTFFSGNPIYRVLCPVCSHPYLASEVYQVDEFEKKRCIACLLKRIEELESEISSHSG